MTPPPDFGELTLWQVLQLFLYHPGPTTARFFRVIMPPYEGEAVGPAEIITPRFPVLTDDLAPESESLLPDQEALTAPLPPDESFPQRPYPVLFVALLAAILLAIIGGQRLWSAATDPLTHVAGDVKESPLWFFVAILIYVGVSVAASLPWWRTLLFKSDGDGVTADSPAPVPPAETRPPLRPVARFFRFVEQNALRLTLMPFGVLLAGMAYLLNVKLGPQIDGKAQVENVVFTPLGTLAWGAAIALWFVILAGPPMNGAWGWILRLGQWRGWRPRIQSKVGWHWAALVVILLVGAYLRLYDLEGVPPEMTSDHIEKLLDAQRTTTGYKAIFFPNNGGREAFQMYFVGLLAQLGGLGFSFETLKLATVIEGLLTLPAGFWLGRAIMGHETAENRRMGIWLGLVFAGLLAISSWHIMLSRLGLRIALTPLTTTLALIYLIRVMRHNRRGDYVILGLILGVGIYFYQSNRMLPLVVALGVFMAALVYSRSLQDVGRYIVNMACLVIMAVVVFVPMFRYEQEYPDAFWNRTRGRLFGENAFVQTDPETGISRVYEPSRNEQIERFFDEFDGFQTNTLNALRMWSWRGDSQWINNGDYRPAFDPYTDGVFLLGVAAWLLLIMRHWDIAHLLIPFGVMIMLLPSSLALAFPSENPSFTRASGTIPFVFLVAAYPLAQAGYYAERLMNERLRWLGLGLGVGLLAIFLGLASWVNYNTYFDVYRADYAAAWKPYSRIAQPMQEFATGEGSYGNAFMIAWPHWLDHRILGEAAGDLNWPNGLVNREDVFAFVEYNQGTPYAYDPAKPLFFMYHNLDAASAEWLRSVFPDGEERRELIEESPSNTFYIYTVPPQQDFAAIRLRLRDEED